MRRKTRTLHLQPWVTAAPVPHALLNAPTQWRMWLRGEPRWPRWRKGLLAASPALLQSFAFYRSSLAIASRYARFFLVPGRGSSPTRRSCRFVIT